MESDKEQPQKPLSGEEYLRQLGEEYRFYKDNILPALSEDAFEHQKESRHKIDGVEGFLADFAIAAEERRRAIERWTEGAKLPEADKELAEKVHEALPAFAVVNPETLGAMKVESVRKYRIDTVSEDILNQIAARLPRKIDAYRYHQGYAEDSIEVEGLGEIKVTLHEFGDGVFSNISEVKSDEFRIWNCRKSGVTYLNRFNDLSLPSDIEINPLNLEIQLYGDESGIYIGKEGKRFTNSRVATAVGKGYSSDTYRDDLHRTYSGPNPQATPREGYTNENWREDKTVLSWKEVEDEAIVWLVDKVLNPLKQAPKPEHQETFPPDEEPFPDGKIGPLFAFVEMKDIERIARIKDDPAKAYPHERKAIRTYRRLFSLNTPIGEGIPKEAHDGYIWCGVGKVDEKTDMDKLSIAHEDRRTDTSFGHNEGIAVIKPKYATDIYVVDWQKWDDYREKTFTKDHDRLTKDEVVEMYWEVGRTMVPITEYEGGYNKPVVLIGKALEMDEIDTVYFPPEEKTNFFGEEATSV